jgi:ribosomal protein S17E
MLCPNCGKEMEKHPGYWLCKKGHNIQVPIKEAIKIQSKKVRNIAIGYCANCGKFVQRLYDFDVSGLCDECSDDALEMIEKHLLLRGNS